MAEEVGVEEAAVVAAAVEEEEEEPEFIMDMEEEEEGVEAESSSGRRRTPSEWGSLANANGNPWAPLPGPALSSVLQPQVGFRVPPCHLCYSFR